MPVSFYQRLRSPRKPQQEGATRRGRGWCNHLSLQLRWFFFVFGLVYFLESIGGFYMTSAVVFIEKQFQIPSRLSGMMVSASDFAYIPVIIFTAYFGGKGNRAKWIGAGCILISIANFLISASNFLFNRAEYEQDLTNVSASFQLAIQAEVEKEFNMSSIREDEIRPMEMNVRALAVLPYAFCDRELNHIRDLQAAGECIANPPVLGPFFMIFGGLLILGVGRTMPFSLGLPLMDDNVKKSNLPVYFAIMFASKVMGPVVGLLVGGQLNKIYYNFDPPQGLTTRDPMWIGCWWLGFLIFGGLLFFPSLALFFFPSDKHAEEEEKRSEVEMVKLNENGHGNGEAAKTKKDATPQRQQRLILVDKHKKETGHLSAEEEFRSFLKTLWDLLFIPIYMGAMFGRVLDVLAFKGFFTFLAKYLQLQFDMPQHVIQKHIAFAGVLGFASGVAMGSFAMKKLKLQGRRAATWVALCSLVAACLSFSNGLVGCENVTSAIGKQGKTNNFTFASCDKSCGCEDVPLFPVCDEEGKSFYSPCHAGCPVGGREFNLFNHENKTEETYPIFGECKCAGGNQTVSRKFCTRPECEAKFKLFFVFQSLGAFVGGMGVVPGMLIILRAVPPEHRSVSLGFNGFVVSLFATLPSPVFWGKIIDMSCLQWPTFCGDRTAACQLYDMDELRVRIHVIYGSIRIISLISDIWVIYFAKGLKLTDDEEDEEQASPPSDEEQKSRRPTLVELEVKQFEEEVHNRTL